MPSCYFASSDNKEDAHTVFVQKNLSPPQFSCAVARDFGEGPGILVHTLSDFSQVGNEFEVEDGKQPRNNDRGLMQTQML